MYDLQHCKSLWKLLGSLVEQMLTGNLFDLKMAAADSRDTGAAGAGRGGHIINPLNGLKSPPKICLYTGNKVESGLNWIRVHLLCCCEKGEKRRWDVGALCDIFPVAERARSTWRAQQEIFCLTAIPASFLLSLFLSVRATSALPHRRGEKRDAQRNGVE